MAGDADFAAFYEANYERLVVQLFAVTGNLQDAEDVVQEAFARACLRWRRLHAYGRPAAWCGGWRSIWPCRACGVPAARSGWRAGRTRPAGHCG
jgi:predicted RNA polymerase sigma factor